MVHYGIWFSNKSIDDNRQIVSIWGRAGIKPAASVTPAQSYLRHQRCALVRRRSSLPRLQEKNRRSDWPQKIFTNWEARYSWKHFMQRPLLCLYFRISPESGFLSTHMNFYVSTFFDTYRKQHLIGSIDWIELGWNPRYLLSVISWPDPMAWV